jgi:hypothetical protein
VKPLDYYGWRIQKVLGSFFRTSWAKLTFYFLLFFAHFFAYCSHSAAAAALLWPSRWLYLTRCSWCELELPRHGTLLASSFF